MSKLIIVEPVIYGSDIITGFLDDGLLKTVNTNKVGEYMFVVGIDISYDSVYYRNWNKFAIVNKSELELITLFNSVVANPKAYTEFVKKQAFRNIGTLLFSILNPSVKSEINKEYSIAIQRQDLFVKYINPNIQTVTREELATKLKLK